ncbi:flagellin N-terminal helical domain-containing protein [Granulicella tundricola]|uniref:Flagellin n=1 Tax=Granulicella tundricola (strain ATCC BAA-1859 / DSM 23138 / MP5ACTX9) TaxID=1198114 RepID=E8WW73_GRATM|nr:flagellin [Granulicella tundricola]ADW68456.1 flagellin domain protein [Granulicella tundricola MP5ACTX9]
MSLGVLNNIAAIYAQNNLNNTQASLQNTLTQLSSGSRINSGSDDAAGLAVADGLAANESALTQSAANASDGIGLLQTADGALSQVTNLLNRAVTLSTEAANGTLNSNQVSSANQEYQNILSEIGNIGVTTNFNGRSVFTSTAKTVFVSDGTVSGANVYSDVVGTLAKGGVGETAPVGAGIAITNPTPTASTLTAGSVATFGALAATTDSVGGTISVAVGTGGTAVVSTIAKGTALSDVVSQLNAQYNAANNGVTASLVSGKLTITGPQDAANTTAGTNTLVVTGTALTDYAQATSTAGPAAGIDFTQSTVSTLTQATAQTVLTTVTSAIAAVAYQRGIIGADVNQLTAASGVASTESENLTAAESNIRETNYGQATSDLAKYEVLSQTGISALAQANSVQQEVLKLLQ